MVYKTTNPQTYAVWGGVAVAGLLLLLLPLLWIIMMLVWRRRY